MKDVVDVILTCMTLYLRVYIKDVADVILINLY